MAADGWFTGQPGQPEICIVTGYHNDDPAPNELVEVGNEHNYIMPCSAQQLLAWINDGLVDTYCCSLVLVHVEVMPSTYQTSITLTTFLLRKITTVEERLIPEIVVFWCNGAKSDSPAASEAYFKLLKKNCPESKQVMVLQDGTYVLRGKTRQESGRLS